MKKLLLIVTLMLALIVTVVACTEETEDPANTVADTTIGEEVATTDPAEETTETPEETTEASEETTEASEETTVIPEDTTDRVEETEEPEETEPPELYYNFHIDPAYPVFADGTLDHESAVVLWDNPAAVVNLTGEHTKLYMTGWIAYIAKEESGVFGYKLDGGELIIPENSIDGAEKAVKDWASANGFNRTNRCTTYVDVSELTGEHTLTLIYKDIYGINRIVAIVTICREA